MGCVAKVNCCGRELTKTCEIFNCKNHYISLPKITIFTSNFHISTFLAVFLQPMFVPFKMGTNFTLLPLYGNKIFEQSHCVNRVEVCQSVCTYVDDLFPLLTRKVSHSNCSVLLVIFI